MSPALQPLLHDRLVVLRAPAQVWSGPDGSIGGGAIDGVFVSDLRVIAEQRVALGGRAGEHISTSLDGADTVRFVALHRELDAPDPDPDTRSIHERQVNASGCRERIVLSSRRDQRLRATLAVHLRLDASQLEHVKAGLDTAPELSVEVAGSADTVSWRAADVVAHLSAPDARIRHDGAQGLTLEWDLVVPARGSVSAEWSVSATDAKAVVAAPASTAPWSRPDLTAGDERLARWLDRALGDLDALRLTVTPSVGPAARADAAPDQFLAAGAPWFFTLFGRDSIWAARLLLPLGTELAAGTLRVLASLQGTSTVHDTAEQPGKIMHELRRGTLEMPSEGISLPPLYYGTVDATPLWICLLHDAWRWGMPEPEVRALLPNLVAALEWMRDFGDSDGDGLLEYVDETGHGLSNQGWKDSGDSVQWRDGRLADGPIALCEVQGYAFEAAVHGADLIEHFGGDGDEWRQWAARLKRRFDETFWVPHAEGAYPAIALDASKHPVDTVTSNIGHLLGTGLLDERQSALVARRLGSPTLDSGFGLRTMSTDSQGYWPLSYHGGSVWTHDTAIVIAGLTRAGHRDVADSLSRGLLAAASAFDYRVPELHSGDGADEVAVPVPYPAACRPQAWSAAAAVGVLASALGLEPDDDGLSVAPSPLARDLRVSGLRVGGVDVALRTNSDAEVVEATGAPVTIG